MTINGTVRGCVLRIQLPHPAWTQTVAAVETLTAYSWKDLADYNPELAYSLLRQLVWKALNLGNYTEISVPEGASVPMKSEEVLPDYGSVSIEVILASADGPEVEFTIPATAY
jgi:hypothetical protein